MKFNLLKCNEMSVTYSNVTYSLNKTIIILIVNSIQAPCLIMTNNDNEVQQKKIIGEALNP